ncbi:hypothetical protein CROQUDRAFT_73247 [Cronartium quercuum f. sp. fusiforme G11]|uniref:Uncharacterized protein n=1 Tax=Cronartium quercuum f. sp. fusiforme G11 TaxID=708437 RepID=A0A9P6NN28_9BASI|nr:hypothetical protein CROQUDRAFT_73247 [Cronartium quercuum f. sp. fusiforme G11]
MSTTTAPYDVLLIGLGAVGGVYGYVLEHSKRCRVTAIARSAFDSISQHGITINSQKFGKVENWKPYRLVQRPEQATDRNYRLIICAFKCLPDIQPTSSILAPFLVPQQPNSPPPSTAVVLIQNGIGIEQPLAEAFPSIHIISCVAWIGANLIQNPTGPVIEHGKMEKLVIGLYDGEGFSPSFTKDEPCTSGHFINGLLDNNGIGLIGEAREEKRMRGKQEVELFASLLSDGGGEVEVLEFIQPARWGKNLWNGSLSTMCALSRTPVSALLAPEVLPHTLPVIRRTMLEIIYVARGLGYRESDLPAQSVDDTIQITILNYQAKKSSAVTEDEQEELNDDVFEEEEEEEEESEAEKVDPFIDFKPSMLIDLELGRPMELEPILGAVLDRARSKAIETPRLDLLYSSLKISQESAARSHAARLETVAQEKHLHTWAMRKPSVGGSGTSESREAWMKEVVRRAKLGGSVKIQAKVTGKPLA